MNRASDSRNLGLCNTLSTHLLLRVRGAACEGGGVDDVRLGVEDVPSGVHHALVAVVVVGAVDDGGDVATVVDEVVLVEEKVEVPEREGQ